MSAQQREITLRRPILRGTDSATTNQDFCQGTARHIARLKEPGTEYARTLCLTKSTVPGSAVDRPDRFDSATAHCSQW
jgi:hypothetical protein